MEVYSSTRGEKASDADLPSSKGRNTMSNMLPIISIKEENIHISVP